MSGSTKYKVLRKLADGGMAEIFLAQLAGPHGFEKLVVLKRIRPNLSTPSFRDLLLNEAHVAMRLNHSNIVQVLDLGESAGRYFLCLELVEGWSVEQLLRRARATEFPLPPQLALHIAVEVCRALAYAHGATSGGKPLGIVHRDVSPQNILVSEQGEVKLTDFGIAKVSSRPDTTQNGMVKGKVAFMSPEQASAAPLDARSDLFSLGTVLYYMVTDQMPFVGQTVVETMAQIVSGKFVAPHKVNRALDGALSKTISTALRLKPSARFQTADAMLHEMEKVMRHSFAPVGRTELKAWLSELSNRDRGLPIGRATLSKNAKQVDVDESVEIVTSSMLAHSVSSVHLAPPQESRSMPAVEPSPEPTDRPSAPRRWPGGWVLAGLAMTLSVVAVVRPWRALNDKRHPGEEPSLRAEVPRESLSAEASARIDAGENRPAVTATSRPPTDVDDEISHSVVASPAEVILGEEQAVASRDSSPSQPPQAAAKHDSPEETSKNAAVTSRPEPTDSGPKRGSLIARPKPSDAPAARGTPQKPQAKDDTVSVAFATVPSGALIKVRNDVRQRLFGPTPISLRFRPGILYEVTFLRRGYAPETRQFQVASRKNQKVFAQMKKTVSVRRK
jgi:serine/threonine-protein kinase